MASPSYLRGDRWGLSLVCLEWGCAAKDIGLCFPILIRRSFSRGRLKRAGTRVVALDWKVFGMAHHLHDVQGGCRCHGLCRRSGGNGVHAPGGNESSDDGGGGDRSYLAHRTLLGKWRTKRSALVVPFSQ